MVGPVGKRSNVIESRAVVCFLSEAEPSVSRACRGALVQTSSLMFYFRLFLSLKKIKIKKIKNETCPPE